MILWVSPRTSSLAARLAFAMCGMPGEVREISLRAGDARSPEFIALNPKGQVPVLELEGGMALTETPAILMALGEMFPDSNLLGTSRAERWQVMEWLAWVAWTVPGAFLPGFDPGRFGPAPAEEGIRSAALARADLALVYAGSRIEGRGWAVGGTPTAADCSLALLTVLGGFLGIAPPEALMAHRRRFFALPALRDALTAEGFAT
ncbi:glutathione S-transferase family protein [Sabulicella rubraurantiaca]|uniref:glutathione S-transferase family protein n=1 Tax=Sabulicella rubraurantiaca TaxID=2811429 RepID=UPI001A965E79|nr:glutathione S-transferase family protein [Sabulicella rubraurantiaca]